MFGALYVSNTSNSKVAGNKKVDATYASIEATCPKTCPLKSNGCYAEVSFVAITANRLAKAGRGLTPLQVARAEAREIDSSYAGGAVPKDRALRLHVSGDARTIESAKVLSKAIDRWKKRGGGKVWSYTHAWRQVPRSAWGNVSVLASIESVKDVAAVQAQGYVPAIVVDHHISEKAYKLPGSDIKWVPCLQQTRDISCSDCRLCFDDKKLKAIGAGIAFAAHGAGTNKVKRRLQVIK
jgi:hypothetical protein